jgi:hypothetical protein
MTLQLHLFERHNYRQTSAKAAFALYAVDHVAICNDEAFKRATPNTTGMNQATTILTRAAKQNLLSWPR